VPAGFFDRLSIAACKEALQRIGGYAGIAELLRCP
jgi:hypothetical protein